METILECTENKEETREAEETREKIGTCICCGAVIFEGDEYKDDHGTFICQECFEEEYFICDGCGEIHSNDEQVWVHDSIYTNRGFYVCESCADNNYYQCDECEEYFTGSYIRSDDYGHCICDECYERYDYVTCENCGEILLADDAEYSENREEWYCSSCYPGDDEEDAIHDYSFKPDPIFHGSGPFFMGVELEIDKGDNVRECASALKTLSERENHFYLKDDGSLDNGIEIVTHPCSLEYHENSFPWKEVVKTAKEYKFKSHDAETCGLHIHVNRNSLGADSFEKEATIAKIILLVDRFWNQMVKFSRRGESEMNRWAKKPDADIQETDTLDDIVDKVKNSSDSRYYAVNLENWNTIEFRMYRGTLNLSTIMATLQFTKALCFYAKNTELEECMKVSWNDLATALVSATTGTELLSYFQTRGLY